MEPWRKKSEKNEEREREKGERWRGMMRNGLKE